MVVNIDAMKTFLGEGIPKSVPEHPGISADVDHAPKRRQILTKIEKRLALKNTAYRLGLGVSTKRSRLC